MPMAITILFDTASLTVYAEPLDYLTKEAIVLADLAALQQIIGISFNDPSLPGQALVQAYKPSSSPVNLQHRRSRIK